MSQPDPISNLPSGSVEELAKHIDQFEGLQRRVLLTRFSVILLLILMICGFIYGLYMQIEGLTQPSAQAQIQQLATVRLQQDSPRIMRYIEQASGRVIPVYSDAFQRKYHEKYPSFLRQAQIEQMQIIDYMKTDLKMKLLDRMDGIIQKQAEKLVNRYPELSDEAVAMQLMHNVNLIFTDALHNVLYAKFDSHIEKIGHIQSKMDQLLTEAGGETIEKNLEMKLLAASLELAGKKMYDELEKVERGR